MKRKGEKQSDRAAVSFGQRALFSCVTPVGFVAGNHHFVDLWARDSLFATLGANVCGLSEVSRQTIETFLTFQRADGLVPFLVRRSQLTIGKYIGKHTYHETPKAQFRSSQSGGIVPDGGLLTVIAAEHYAEITRDAIWLRQQYARLSSAMAWYHNRFGDRLIREWFQCEWADAVMKIGTTLYTNVLYWKALGDMALIAKRVRKLPDAKVWNARQRHIGDEINRQLWTGEFFADWKNVFRHDYFASHGNMLAVVWGLANRQQADRILSFAQRYCWHTFTLETNYPSYPAWRIPLINYLTGTANYHNRGCLWLQPGILYAVALRRAGKRMQSKWVFHAIAAQITQYQGVFEVYEKDGTPVRRLLYRAEQPFAWSAGLFVWASHILVEAS